MVTWSPGVPISGSLRTLLQCPVTSALHIGNSQGSFIGDCHSHEETWVGQEICRDAQHSPKTTLASCACPWTSSLPDTCSPKQPFRWQALPIPFPIIPKLQLNPHPLPFLHIPQLSRTSLYSFLHQPHTHPLIPCPMNFLDASLLTLIPKPIGLVSRPLLFLQFQA